MLVTNNNLIFLGSEVFKRRHRASMPANSFALKIVFTPRAITMTEDNLFIINLFAGVDAPLILFNDYILLILSYPARW
jgi:hypothetical protein